MCSEPQSEIDLNKEWTKFFALQSERTSKPIEFSYEKYKNALVPVIGKILQYKGIDIKNYSYKETANYLKIKNIPITGLPGGFMSFEEFIERFLLDRNDGCYYDSLYDLGNPIEFPKQSDYSYESVADDIACLLYPDKDTADISEVIKEIKKIFDAKHGLIERMKKYLDFDLNSFDKNFDSDSHDGRKKRSRRECCKILHFFYLLEHKIYPNKNVLLLLEKPSMESIDNSILGWETHNGEVTRLVKKSLGKELSLEDKNRIYSTIKSISIIWDDILKNAQLLLDFLYDYGFDYKSVELMPSLLPVFECDERNSADTYQYPIEKLYLIVSQREFLGNLLDIISINNIQNNKNYYVPPELVEEMKELTHVPVDFNNAEEYIKENASRLSRYVYLGKRPSKEDVRRIRTFAHKFSKFKDFCHRAKPLMDMREISDELQLVSFLQALILDNQSETFDYTYHGYQNKAKHMMRVQAALKNDKHVPDALQGYWVRKVTDRWYANVGKYEVRLKLRKIEQICDEVRKQILNQSSLDKMIAAHDFYLERLDPSVFDVKNWIQMISDIVKSLQNIGFKYEDRECRIRYAFLDSDNCSDICKHILAQIQFAIHNYEPSCQIECEPNGTAVKDAGFLLELSFDYRKKVCTLIRFDLVLG